MKTKIEKMLLKVAMERMGHLENYEPYSITNELHGLLFFAIEARGEGMVSDALYDELEEMINTTRKIDMKRSIDKLIESVKGAA